MKKIFQPVAAIVAIVFLLSISVFAQKDKSVSNMAQNYVISARAGGVNYVEGGVTVVRKSKKSGYLNKNDTLEIGDKVSTGTSGKAEILLNPGSYIRLAENSEFEFVTTSLDDLKLRLIRGSAILEVYAADDFRVILNTPGAQFYLVESGVYRVDAVSETNSKIAVWKGKALVGNAQATIIKGGREANVNGSQVGVFKFDRDEKNSLETWSKTRAKDLAKLNARLERKALRETLISSYGANGWNIYSSFGLWVYDAASSSHCFFPFGYGWNSPYGYNLGSNFWNVQLPGYIYNQAPIYPATNGGNTNGGNNNNASAANDSTPPFQQIQNSGGVRSIRDNPAAVNDVSPTPSSNPQPIRDTPQPIRDVVQPQQAEPTKTSKDN